MIERLFSLATLRILAIGLALAAMFQVNVHAQAAGEKASPKMKYDFGWYTANAVTFEVNRRAANGWRLKSSTMMQCPMREPGKTFPCVMIVMEIEDK